MASAKQSSPREKERYIIYGYRLAMVLIEAKWLVDHLY